MSSRYGRDTLANFNKWTFGKNDDYYWSYDRENFIIDTLKLASKFQKREYYDRVLELKLPYLKDIIEPRYPPNQKLSIYSVSPQGVASAFDDYFNFLREEKTRPKDKDSSQKISNIVLSNNAADAAEQIIKLGQTNGFTFDDPESFKLQLATKLRTFKDGESAKAFIEQILPGFDIKKIDIIESAVEDRLAQTTERSQLLDNLISNVRDFISEIERKLFVTKEQYRDRYKKLLEEHKFIEKIGEDVKTIDMTKGDRIRLKKLFDTLDGIWTKSEKIREDNKDYIDNLPTGEEYNKRLEKERQEASERANQMRAFKEAKLQKIREQLELQQALLEEKRLREQKQLAKKNLVEKAVKDIVKEQIEQTEKRNKSGNYDETVDKIDKLFALKPDGYKVKANDLLVQLVESYYKNSVTPKDAGENKAKLSVVLSDLIRLSDTYTGKDKEDLDEIIKNVDEVFKKFYYEAYEFQNNEGVTWKYKDLAAFNPELVMSGIDTEYDKVVIDELRNSIAPPMNFSKFNQNRDRRQMERFIEEEFAKRLDEGAIQWLVKIILPNDYSYANLFSRDEIVKFIRDSPKISEANKTIFLKEYDEQSKVIAEQKAEEKQSTTPTTVPAKNSVDGTINLIEEKLAGEFNSDVQKRITEYYETFYENLINDSDTPAKAEKNKDKLADFIEKLKNVSGKQTDRVKKRFIEMEIPKIEGKFGEFMKDAYSANQWTYGLVKDFEAANTYRGLDATNDVEYFKRLKLNLASKVMNFEPFYKLTKFDDMREFLMMQFSLPIDPTKIEKFIENIYNEKYSGNKVLPPKEIYDFINGLAPAEFKTIVETKLKELEGKNPSTASTAPSLTSKIVSLFKPISSTASTASTASTTTQDPETLFKNEINRILGLPKGKLSAQFEGLYSRMPVPMGNLPPKYNSEYMSYMGEAIKKLNNTTPSQRKNIDFDSLDRDITFKLLAFAPATPALAPVVQPPAPASAPAPAPAPAAEPAPAPAPAPAPEPAATQAATPAAEGRIQSNSKKSAKKQQKKTEKPVKPKKATGKTNAKPKKSLFL